MSVIDPAPSIGRGLAYSTCDPRHLLNVRVANMSAFANKPEHLLNWLRRRSGEDAPTAFCFISRNTYGDYVSDVARQALDSGPSATSETSPWTLPRNRPTLLCGWRRG